MGILRSIGKGLFGFLFTISLAALILVLALENFTNYENLKPTFVNIVKDQFNMTPQQLNSTYSALSKQCNTTGNKTIYIDEYGLECSEILKIMPSDLPEFISNSTFDKIYFKKYDCQFFECINLPEDQRILFLLGNQSNEFFKNIIIYITIATILNAILLFVITETWPGRFKAIGITLLLSGISYFIIDFIKNIFLKQLQSQIMDKVSLIVNQIFNSVSVFLFIILIIGAVLTATGFIIGFIQKKQDKK